MTRFSHLRLPMFFLGVIVFALSITAYANQEIGKVTAIQGWAMHLPQGFVKQNLKVGSPIYANSEVRTGHQSRLAIRFYDGSRLNLGEWASTTVDDYAFKLLDGKQTKPAPKPTKKTTQKAKPAASKPKARNRFSLKVSSGVFRYVSGLIAKRNRKAVRIGTPVATLGLRGTELFGGPVEAGMPPGEIHYGFMIIKGGIDVINEHGSVVLDSPGEGTFLPMKGHKAPTPPARWGKTAVDESTRLLAFN